MNKMNIIDMHCDTLLEMHTKGRGLRELDGHINLDKLRCGGSLLQCFAVYTPTHGEAESCRITSGPWEYFNAAADIFEREMEANREYIRPVRSMAEIRANAGAGIISAMLTLEDGVVGVNERGEVFACNRHAEEITRSSADLVMGKPASQVFPYLPFSKCLQERERLPAKIIRLNGINVSAEVVPVMRQRACIGAFAILQRFNDVEARQSQLRNAGDMGAFSKLQFTNTGDTLCDPANPIKYPPIEYPAPCISKAVFAAKQGEEDKVFSGLARLMEEDPSIKLEKNVETTETLLSGQGELHLDVIRNKLASKFGANAVLQDPRIPYRETIKKTVKVQGRHKKQSGGHGQFGDVWIEFSPIGDTSIDFEFEDAVVGGVVPRNFIPSVEKGLRENIRKGVLAGYPMVGLHAKLYDGSYHPVDSSEMAFKTAARIAYKKGCMEANPVLLEPIMHVEVYVPDEYMGDVMGDMNKRRGRIMGMNQVDGMQQLVAEAPQAEMFKYATDLRSMTQARGWFTMSFERYEEVPSNVAQKIIENAKLDEDEEE